MTQNSCKVLKGLELAERKDNKLTLIKLNFPMNGYENLTENEIFNLSSAAQDFFYLIYSFSKNEKQQTIKLQKISKRCPRNNIYQTFYTGPRK